MMILYKIFRACAVVWRKLGVTLQYRKYIKILTI